MKNLTLQVRPRADISPLRTTLRKIARARDIIAQEFVLSPGDSLVEVLGLLTAAAAEVEGIGGGQS